MGTALGQNTGFKVYVGPYTFYAGSLWGSGENASGQLGDGTTITTNTIKQIGYSTNWSSISTSSSKHTAAIKTDGTLWTWGHDAYGQLGVGNTTSYSSPVQVGSLTTWSKVDCDGYSTSAIKTDGTLWTWGYNGYGQLGNGTRIDYSSPIQVGSLTNWSKISGTRAIKTDGTLWAWGFGLSFGQIGNGSLSSYSSPIQIGSLTNWSEISHGTYVIAAIKTDGTLWTWGYNATGALGNGTTIHYSSPIQIGSLTNWSKISSGKNYHVGSIKTDGTLWMWGSNTYGQLGNGTNGNNYSSPIQIGSLTNWSKIVCGYQNSIATKTDGTLWAWGIGTSGQLGNGVYVHYSSPIQIGSLTNWGEIAINKWNSFAIPSSTLVVDIQQDLGQRYVSKDYLLDAYPNIASATGARKAPGLWAWGYNTYGGIGNGTTITYSSPVQIGSLTNWKTVGGTRYSTLAVKTDGTLWAWGYNNFGQLGNGTRTDYSSPIQIGSLTNWSKVAGSSDTTSAAIKTNGTLWTWGYNGSGQLGNGTTINYSSPIQIGALTNWKDVCGGPGYHFTAVKTDGTLWVWGYNLYGQLGNGTRSNYSSPIQIGLLTNWKQVSGGENHTSAIKTNGTLWTWGYNGSGQLGNGTTTDYSSPIQIGSLTNWKSISNAYNNTIAIKTDGTLWTWGFNGDGQLGNGTTISYSSPIQVGALTNWKILPASHIQSDFFTALKTDGTIWFVGGLNRGQAGTTINVKYSSPVQIGSLSNWKSFHCGYHIAAIADGYY